MQTIAYIYLKCDDNNNSYCMKWMFLHFIHYHPNNDLMHELLCYDFWASTISAHILKYWFKCKISPLIWSEPNLDVKRTTYGCEFGCKKNYQWMWSFQPLFQWYVIQASSKYLWLFKLFSVVFYGQKFFPFYKAIPFTGINKIYL